MRKKIVYETADGKTFHDRKQALDHEVSVIRIQRIEDFLKTQLSGQSGSPITITQVAQLIGQHSTEFADLISARATRRHLATVGNSAGKGLVGRRPRGQAKAKEAAVA